MKRAALGLSLLLPALFPICATGSPRPAVKGIYGEDDRKDLFEADEAKKALADSIASLWDEQLLEYDTQSGSYTLITRSFADKLGLCPGEPFREQPTGPVCTATLVGEDILLTAGHCVLTAKERAAARFVFGFAIKDDGGAAPATVPATEVYSCAEVLHRYINHDSTASIRADYALVRLDRKVTGHRVLAVAADDTLAKGDALYMFGYPSGLPLKVVDGAKVRDASDPGFFLADLDAFGGNSGSPIFSEKSDAVQGILFAGGYDFRLNADETCVIAYRSGQDEGGGEASTKAALVHPLIHASRAAQEPSQPVSRLISPSPQSLTSVRELRDFTRYQP